MIKRASYLSGSFLLASCLMPAIGFGQSCETATILETTPTERFLIDHEGIVADIYTGKQWRLCTEGQVYTHEYSESEGKHVGSCNGAAINFTSYDAAVSHIKDVNSKTYAGFSDWRIPNIKELSSIVERQCFDPAINLDVFPSTPSTAYITSTPEFDGSKGFRYIYFESGAELAPLVSEWRNLRMVRDLGDLGQDY